MDPFSRGGVIDVELRREQRFGAWRRGAERRSKRSAAKNQEYQKECDTSYGPGTGERPDIMFRGSRVQKPHIARNSEEQNCDLAFNLERQPRFSENIISATRTFDYAVPRDSFTSLLISGNIQHPRQQKLWLDSTSTRN